MVSSLRTANTPRDHVRLRSDVVADGENVRTRNARGSCLLRRPPLFSKCPDALRLGTDADHKLSLNVIDDEDVVRQSRRAIDDSAGRRSEVTLHDPFRQSPVLTDGAGPIGLFRHALPHALR